MGGSLATLLTVFGIAVGSLLTIEYPVPAIAAPIATVAVARSLTGRSSWLSSRAASLRKRTRFGRRSRR